MVIEKIVFLKIIQLILKFDPSFYGVKLKNGKAQKLHLFVLVFPTSVSYHVGTTPLTSL